VKKFLHACGALGALIAAGPTVAADLPVREVAPVYAPDDWSGFYIGAHAGWGWGGDPGISSNGFVGGGQFGYNHQWGAWVGGLELDISGANVKGMANVPVLSSTSIVTTPAPIVTQSENFHLLGSARARIGFLAWPNLLLYGTGGLAWTRFEQSIAETITRTTEFGWAAGAGGEFKITDHWLFRVEYLHYDFGNGPTGSASTTTLTSTSSQAGHLTVDVVRTGLSLRFGNLVPWEQLCKFRYPPIVSCP
jgi:outer membrane immunogenic protein